MATIQELNVNVVGKFKNKRQVDKGLKKIEKSAIKAGDALEQLTAAINTFNALLPLVVEIEGKVKEVKK